ncbi:MAG: universal stress protein [Kofleriaceae bacterium]|nr:universal stress protein [Myxococcales bacterium]MCB9565049.1 universal stress protein [Kofleriaceae bacterium]MCB9573780.1 universal stress protein [Kofleriaceae bacterium]
MPIVCGTDLSELSHEALRAAIAIASRRGDREVHLVHVLDDEIAHDASDATLTKLVDTARDRLEADAARLAAGTDVTVRTDVLVGRSHDALLALAETEDAELLVVTSKGHGNSPLRRLGGVSERIAAAATVPVLVVRDAEPLVAWARGERALRVLVGVDDSAACQGALQLVKSIRRVGPVDVVVGHVYFPDEAYRRYGLKNTSMVEATPELERLLTRDLTRRLGDVPGSGEIVVRPRLGVGRVGDHMLELADAEHVDLVVVGTHRKAGLRRLSSVSSLILHDAKQSVVVVPLSPDSAVDEVPVFRVAVVATDRSAFGNLAVPYGYTLVGDRGEVHLIHVVEDEGAAEDAEVVAELLELAPPSRMGVTTRAHVVHGDDPARTIAETAERLGADVVVVASHGRSGISRALVGSVADKLMRACKRPVLVLRPVA